MKINTTFRTLVFAMLMPAMLLTTACSNINNNEDYDKKGYTLPVTVNVTRQGDTPATRAIYNESEKTLSFSSGDKLFVSGEGFHGRFAGTLTWQGGGTFSGTITTQYAYSGSSSDLFDSSDTWAELLPNGYEGYGCLSIVKNKGYDAAVSFNKNNAIALTKPVAVEQFSREFVFGYNNGFSLSPQNAILNITITGLAVSAPVNVSLTGLYGLEIKKTVTTNVSGTATFATGISCESIHNLNSLTLKVNGTAIYLGGHELSAGHIYNVTRRADQTGPKTAAEATPEDVGKLIGADGYIYADVSAAGSSGTTPIAMIAYVGDAGTADASSSTYKGLAIALTDASTGATWCSQTTDICLAKQYDAYTTDMAGIANTNALVSHGSHTHAAASAARNYNSGTHPEGTSAWFLPSAGQWDKMINACKNVLGTNNNFKDLRDGFTSRGGTDLQEVFYWSSTEGIEVLEGNSYVKPVRYYFYNGNINCGFKYQAHYVRACLAF